MQGATWKACIRCGSRFGIYGRRSHCSLTCWSTRIASCHSFVVTTYPDDTRQDFFLPSQRSCRGACRSDHDRPVGDVQDMLNAWSGRSGASALIMFNAEHLRRILAEYATYYNKVPTHVSLGHTPDRPVRRDCGAPDSWRAPPSIRSNLVFRSDMLHRVLAHAILSCLPTGSGVALCLPSTSIFRSGASSFRG